MDPDGPAASEAPYVPRHRTRPLSAPEALWARYGDYVLLGAVALIVVAVVPDEPPPDAAWTWSVPVAVVIGLLLGYAHVAARGLGGRPAAVSRWLVTWLGGGGVLAYFGLTGRLGEWGALLGYSFIAAIVPGTVLVALHRHGRLHLRLPRRRHRRTTSIYGPDDAG